MKRLLIISGILGVLAVGVLGAVLVLAGLTGSGFGFGDLFNLPKSVETNGSTSGVAGAAGWEVKNVDAVVGSYGGKCSLALDGRGRPHIAYFARPEWPYVRYSWWDGERWLNRPVDTSVKMAYCDLKLALDDRERPHVLYNYSVDAPGESERKICKYARWTGEEWDMRDVATGVKYGADADLLLDGAGRACIAYVRYDEGSDERRSELTYARWDGNGWTREVVAVQNGFGVGVRVMMNAGGEPCILSGRQFFAREGGLWREGAILDNSDSGALDAHDNLHVAFRDDGLIYGRDTESGWKEEAVDEKWGGGGGASLALGRDGLPYISYNNRYGIRFAHFTGEEWVIHTVEEFDRPAQYAFDTWLAVDDEGRPAIAYFDPFTGALKCARWRGGEWRSPPASEADKSKDLTTAGEVVSWYLEGVPHLTKDRRSRIRVMNRGRVLAKPEDGAACLLEFDEPTNAEFVGGRSVRVSSGDMAGETWETYQAWVQIKVGDVVGWTNPGSFFANDYPNPSIARFGKEYSPLREGPSEDAPVVREDVKPGNRTRVGPTAAAGQYFGVVGRVGDWCCLERGFSGIWAPADAPGLEYFYLTYAWEPTGSAQFWFYLPGKAEVDRVLCSVYTYLGAGGLPWQDPRLEVVVDGEKVEAVSRDVGFSGGYESGSSYFEFEFPRAVKREDIESMTFSVGEEGERIHFTIDPHDAWRKPATKRRWPTQGFA